MALSAGALFATTGMSKTLSSAGPTFAVVVMGCRMDDASMATRAMLAVMRLMMRMCRMLSLARLPCVPCAELGKLRASI